MTPTLTEIEAANSENKPPVEIYVWPDRGKVWRCSECRVWVDKGVMKHSTRCDWHGDRTYYPDLDKPGSHEPVAPTKKPATPTRPDIQTAARRGVLWKFYSEEEVQDALKRNKVNMHDVMNQDM